MKEKISSWEKQAMEKVILEITGKPQVLIVVYILAFAYSLSFLCENSHQDQVYFPEIINGFTLSKEKPQ